MTKQLHGIFNDDEVLLNAIKELKSKGIKCTNAYSPFPVHGLDSALGLKRTRISIASFLYGGYGNSCSFKT